jgi:hypothetical protein
MATYLAQNGQQTGPFEDAHVEGWLAEGRCSPNDLAWREGMAEWVPLHALFPGVGRTVSVGPPPLPVEKHLGDDLGTRMLLPVGRSGWAIAAGYFGLFSLIILPAPLALFSGIMAIRDIRKSRDDPHPKHGMGRAVFGLVMGVIGTILLCMAIVGIMTG